MFACKHTNMFECKHANMFAELLMYWFSNIKAFNMRLANMQACRLTNMLASKHASMQTCLQTSKKGFKTHEKYAFRWLN